MVSACRSASSSTQKNPSFQCVSQASVRGPRGRPGGSGRRTARRTPRAREGRCRCASSSTSKRSTAITCARHRAPHIANPHPQRPQLQRCFLLAPDRAPFRNILCSSSTTSPCCLQPPTYTASHCCYLRSLPIRSTSRKLPPLGKGVRHGMITKRAREHFIRPADPQVKPEVPSAAAARGNALLKPTSQDKGAGGTGFYCTSMPAECSIAAGAHTINFAVRAQQHVTSHAHEPLLQSAGIRMLCKKLFAASSDTFTRMCASGDGYVYGGTLPFILDQRRKTAYWE
ncbi:hypothetical protein K438DRAFT_802539 [Mycena galopus ATCC 62051]|nr:hypothetical protein K438DRAFT_802539 [Mycena galopus ATCC 62051]